MTEQLYRWVKAIETPPPHYEYVFIRKPNHRGGAFAQWDGMRKVFINDYLFGPHGGKQNEHEWLEPYAPSPLSANPYEQILQLLITGGFLDPGKLKEARDIIGKCVPSGSLEGFFLPILEENYEASKQIVPGDDYDDKIFTEGEVDLLIETYEDLIEIYKSRAGKSPSDVSGLVDALKWYADDGNYCYDIQNEAKVQLSSAYQDRGKINEKAVKALAQYSTLTAPAEQWKSVEKDGYPEHNIGLLVCIPEEDYHVTSGMWDVSKKWVLLDDYRVPDSPVTHYMKLPKLPQVFQKTVSENDAVMEHLAKLLRAKNNPK